MNARETGAEKSQLPFSCRDSLLFLLFVPVKFDRDIYISVRERIGVDVGKFGTELLFSVAVGQSRSTQRVLTFEPEELFVTLTADGSEPV